MLVIGITGNIGSGKSTISGFFKKLGAKILDADLLARLELSSTSRSFDKIIKAFGPEIIEKGEIDRKKLAKIVFNNPRRLKKLNGIIHPPVLKAISREIDKHRREKKKHILVIDVPLLFETGLDKKVDYAILVNVRKDEGVKRAARKLGISRSEIIKRAAYQMPIKQKIRYADIIIDNNLSKEKARKRVKEICQKLSLRSRK
ncbi:MAG: dephospho-CoA kinase [Candidatus Omnitrophica bacterium]|nr:dephospho-CoA kinase [Candidatus Omnitrophota bacterium]